MKFAGNTKLGQSTVLSEFVQGMSMGLKGLQDDTAFFSHHKQM